MQELSLQVFSEITAITQVYQQEIENYLINKNDEILQDDLAEIVMKLFYEYQKLNDNKSMLDMINNKEIKLNKVIDFQKWKLYNINISYQIGTN